MEEDKNIPLLIRELMLQVFELQAHVGTLRLAVQRHAGISLEDLQDSRAELERRFPIQHVMDALRAVDFQDALKILKEYEGPIQ